MSECVRLDGAPILKPLAMRWTEGNFVDRTQAGTELLALTTVMDGSITDPEFRIDHILGSHAR